MEKKQSGEGVCAFAGPQGDCTCLKQDRCPGRCSFFREKEEYEESGRRWQARMASLNGEEQRRFAVKYYGGRMPWSRVGRAEFPSEEQEDA